MEAQPREVQNYITPDGKNLFAEWLDDLKDLQAIIKIEKRIKRVKLGNLGNYRTVGEGVCELKIDY